MAAIVGAFGWIRRKLTGRKKDADPGDQNSLSPAEEAYQQHAAGQESTHSDNQKTDGRSDSDPNLNKH